MRLHRLSSLAIHSLTALLLTVAACTGGDAPVDGVPPAGAMLQPPAVGVQIASPEFVLQPGEEVFKCYYTSIPANSEVAVRRFHSVMTPGSHHMILYAMQDAAEPDGTFNDCGKEAGGTGLRSLRVWLYASQQPEHEASMPSGVAVPLKARQPVMLNLHYLNASPQPLKVRALINAEYETGRFERAGAFITVNTTIQIPAHGTQTVSGRCKAPEGGKFFTMSTHSHRYTTGASVSLWQGGRPVHDLVRTDDWEHPTIAEWGAPFMVTSAGDELGYSCTYKNDTDDVITVGESASKNEMCMAVGYYFPAKSSAFCLNSVNISP